MAFEEKYDKVNKKYPPACPLFHKFNMLNFDDHCKLTTEKFMWEIDHNLLVVCISRHQKHDYANYDRLVPNFDMTYKTIKRMSVPNLKSFGPTKTELWAKEV